MTKPPEPDYDYGQTLVVQHAETAGPSALTEILDTRTATRPWRLVDVAAGAPFPDLDDVRGIVVLGGPMGVHDTADHPWLDEEIAGLRAALARGVPLFGICLGVQLLGEILGGEVRGRGIPEIGFVPLERTEQARDDPVFAGWPDGAAALFIHDDEVVRLPGGAVAMLTGSDGVAAWRAPDELSYGVQFHPEVDAAQVAAWCSEPRNRIRFERAGVDPDALAAEADRREPFVRGVGLALIGRWLDGVVGRDDPDPSRGRRART